MFSRSKIRFMRSSRKESGYALLSLLLIIALMIIATGIMLPTITFQIKYDREEEMIHRGAQYSRAIRLYFKKFGRYPAKIEDLESSNNLRFLRKRYKDPLNCKPKCADFKLLHYGDVQMAGAMGMGGASMIQGANPVGGNGGLNGPGGLTTGGLNGPGAFGQTSSFGNSSFGSNNSLGSNPNQQTGQNQQGNDGQTAVPDSSQPQPGNQTNLNGPSSGSNASNTQFGGGAIIGVASATKITDPTYREFNHKKKYKDWMFVYDPALDRGQLITGPYEPQKAMFGQGGTPANLNNQINGMQNNNGFGSGQPPAGMQNNPNLPSSGYGNAAPSNNQPQQ